MKRLIFVVLITVCSASWAEWEYLGKTDFVNGDLSLYADKSSIKRKGVITKMWDMMDFSQNQINSPGVVYKSTKTLQAYNCIEQTHVMIHFVNYSSSMGRGDPVYSYTARDSELKWTPVAPESIGGRLIKIACGKK